MIIIDLSDISGMISQDEIEEIVIEQVEDTMNAIYVDLTSSPPVGTPVLSGNARNGWQLDTSKPMEPEIYNMVPYIGKLNRGSSTMSPAGFVEAAIDKNVT